MRPEPTRDLRIGEVGSFIPDAALEWRRITVRFALLVLAFSIVVYLDEVALDNAVMKVLTEASAAAIGMVLRVFGAAATSTGELVTYAGQEFVVTPECTGYEVLALFGAAVIAVPISWTLRLRGLWMGIPILILINFVRMLSLVFVGAHWPEFHDIGHLYTWPIIVITVALGLWLTWINSAYARLDRFNANSAAMKMGTKDHPPSFQIEKIRRSG